MFLANFIDCLSFMFPLSHVSIDGQENCIVASCHLPKPKSTLLQHDHASVAPVILYITLVLVTYNSSKINANYHIHIHSMYKINNCPLSLRILKALYIPFMHRSLLLVYRSICMPYKKLKINVHCYYFPTVQLVSGLSLFLCSNSTPWSLSNCLIYTYYVQYN